MTDHETEQVTTTAIERRRQPRYMQLGATLYMAATRDDLMPLLNQAKLPGLRSLAVCTEDAVPQSQLGQALGQLEAVLERLQPVSLMRFVRPRNPEVLARILRMPGATGIDGLVLPKVDEANLPAYAELAARMPHLLLMPTVETDIAFDRGRLERLRDALGDLPNPVLCLRIGGNDLLQLLRLKRPKHLTAYDTPLRAVINDMITVFRPAGFELCAPVFEHLDSQQTLEREIEMDLVHGLWSKTAIHPTQVGLIEAAYRVSHEEHELATRILHHDASAVFLLNGQMCEPATHCGWATRILERAEIYGTDG